MSAFLEAAAVILGLVYLLLAIRERRSCWLAGGLASLLFLWLFYEADLPMQALLQLYYAAVAVHGWLHWRRGDDSIAPAPHRMAPSLHVLGILACLCLASASVWLRGTLDDPQAWLDSLTSWGGVLATWLVARKVLECWLYWIVIDALSALLYLHTELYATTALFILYMFLAYLGWKEWLKHYHRASATPASA